MILTGKTAVWVMSWNYKEQQANHLLSDYECSNINFVLANFQFAIRPIGLLFIELTVRSLYADCNPLNAEIYERIRLIVICMPVSKFEEKNGLWIVCCLSWWSRFWWLCAFSIQLWFECETSLSSSQFISVCIIIIIVWLNVFFTVPIFDGIINLFSISSQFISWLDKHNKPSTNCKARQTHCSAGLPLWLVPLALLSLFLSAVIQVLYDLFQMPRRHLNETSFSLASLWLH